MSAKPEPASESVRRPRDAAATRESLLSAARTLFAERGYDRTTLRQVAEVAGVDAALVARYFGSKEGLYLAVFSSESATPLDRAGGRPDLVAKAFMDRWEKSGPGPFVQALLRPELEESVRDRVLKRLREKAITPMVSHLEGEGVDDALLRSQLIVAALFGVGSVRAAGGLPELSDADYERVLELLQPAITALADLPPE